ncbi:MAG: phenylalanine--tRNA ligase subunit alpha [Spartobacteria bacterium Tous-C9RFEB]|nr:MAG: phenylalanine--tRNA ligase subunit alpha [Spartobacteria bacterium Tous-C9RFEB]
MEQQVEALRGEALAEIAAAKDRATLEAARIRYLGKSGAVTAISEGMRNVPKEDRPRFGKLLNDLRQAVTQALDDSERLLLEAADSAAVSSLDLSLPGTWPSPGTLHPLTQLMDRAVRCFRRMGFAIADGPDIETEWHCFDALNTPADHPARNEQDTFYLPDGRLLRSHTSSVQIRVMENCPPPIRIIAPGAAYRRDEVDATHLAQFTQMEGLYVAEKVSLADLKGTLEFFFRELFGSGTNIQFRPHFFPFTEPSYEIDIRTEALGNEWMELAGCGMVDPAVFEAICERRGDRVFDPEKVSGFAFGFGLERLAMNLSRIPDIRMLVENDLRFLNQF